MREETSQMIHNSMMQSLSARRDAACPNNEQVDTILQDIRGYFLYIRIGIFTFIAKCLAWPVNVNFLLGVAPLPA